MDALARRRVEVQAQAVVVPDDPARHHAAGAVEVVPVSVYLAVPHGGLARGGVEPVALTIQALPPLQSISLRIEIVS